MTSESSIVVFEEAGTALVGRVTGEIDLSNADRLTALITQRTEDRDLVLDLAEVEFMDSAGIRMLFDLEYHMRDREKRLCLVLPEESRLLRRVVFLTGVDDTVEIHDAVPDALRAIGIPA
jgi:anti-anti-sigma factor